MASKKKTSSTDELGYKIPVKTGSKTMRTIRSSGVDKTTGSRAGSSLRARGIEKGNTAGARGSKTMTTARSSGAEKMPAPKVTSNAQSLRAAGAKAKANKTSPSSARSSGAESKKATPRMGTLRSRGVEKGAIKGPGTTTPKLGKSSYPQSLRAAGAKKEETGSPSSFRAQRFGKGKRGGSAQVTPRSNQSMRAAEYKKKNPGKY